MKRKSILFSLFVLLFGFGSTLCCFNSVSDTADAVSHDASVWTGQTVTDENQLEDSDWYNLNENTFYIRSARGLSYFAYSVNNGTSYRDKTVYLETDIDLDNKEWTPIGNSTSKFQGLFYGQGYSIFNMSIKNDNSGYVGFFGSLTDYSRISNLHLKDVNINIGISSSLSNYYIGSMVGYFNNTGVSDKNFEYSYFYNCSAEGSLTISGSGSTSSVFHIGGFVGDAERVNIETCKSEVDINISSIRASAIRVGGFAGTVNASSLDKFNYDGDLTIRSTSANRYIGGLMGYAAGESRNRKTTIANSYTVANISNAPNTGSTRSELGGLVGRVNNEYFSVNNFYHVGDIDGGSSGDGYGKYLGGIVAYFNSASSTNTTLTDSFHIGSLKFGSYVCSTNETYGNGVARYLYYLDSNLSESRTPTATCLYYDVNQKIAGSSDISSQIVNLDQLARTEGFYGSERYWTSTNSWDFSSESLIWGISSSVNGGYPYLVQNNRLGSANNDNEYSNDSVLEGQGTAESPYLIRTAGDLGYVSFNHKRGAYYALQNNIDLIGRTWQPIGGVGNPFSGVFDGNGYTIYNMTCSLQEQFSYHGLFGNTSNAVIKNLNIQNVRYINQGQVGTGYVGTFVAYASGDTYLINCTDNLYGQASGTLGDGSKVYAVGRVARNAEIYVFYGSNSIDYTGQLIVNDGFYGYIDLSGTRSTSASNQATIYYGYDIELNGNGGTFYDASKTTYKGVHQILLLPRNELDRSEPIVSGIVNCDILDISDIDSTFGLSLPQLSHLFGKSDVIIKDGGFKASYYKYSSDTSGAAYSNPSQDPYNLHTLQDDAEEVKTLNVNFSYKPLLGFDVIWRNYGFDPNDPDGVDINSAFRVKVIYNRYEQDNFDISSIDYHSTSDVKIDSNGDVYKIFYLKYDSFLSDYPEIFVVPDYVDENGEVAPLRDGSFDIKGIYQSYKNSRFSEQIINSADVSGNDDVLLASEILVNSTFADAELTDQGVYLVNLYAEWEGLEKDDEDKFKLTLNFSTDQNTFAGKLDVASVVETLSLSFGGNAVNDETTYAIVENNVANFYFDTMYSDRVDNYIQLGIKLKTGYTFSGELTFDEEEYLNNIDTNFGNLKRSSNSSYYVYNEVAYTNQRTVQFFNLCYDFSINIIIQRARVNNSINVGEGVYFGLSPMVSGWSNVSMLNFQSNSFVSLQSMVDDQQKDEEGNTIRNSYISSVNTNAENQYIGFDYFKKRVMTSNSIYDSFEVAEGQYINSGRAIFRYDFNNNSSRYYLYEEQVEEIEEDGQMIERNVVYLYEIDFQSSGAYSKTDELVSIVYKNSYQYILRHYSYSTFAFIFSTDTTTTEFDDVTMLNNLNSATGSSYTREIKRNPESNHLTKILMTFEDLLYLVDIYNRAIEPIEISTIYTQALFAFRTMYLNSAGEVVEFGSDGAPPVTQKPILSITSEIYAVTTDSSFEVSVTSSRYYRFFANRGSSSVTGNEDNGSIILYNAENYPGSTTVQETTDSFNVQINVSNANTVPDIEDEELADQLNREYENEFNTFNGRYFETSVSVEKGNWIYNELNHLEYQDDVYTLTFSYSSSENVAGLQPGYYEMTIVCTDVLYDMASSTKFVDADVDVEDLDNNGNNVDGLKELVDEEASGIVTSISVNNTAYSANQPTIKYEDEIAIETHMTDNLAYEFWGWFVQGSNYSSYIQKNGYLPSSPTESNVATWNFEYFSQYFVTDGMTNYNENYQEVNPYNITITAIYQKKQTMVTLSNQVIVYEEDGSMTEGSYNAASLGLGFQIQMDSTFAENGSSLTNQLSYKYLSTDQSSGEITQLTNFKFIMAGSNANGYYLSGFRLYRQDGTIANDVFGESIESVSNKGVDLSADSEYSIDLYAKIKALMEDGQTDLIYEFSITPIVRQKTATVTFHSGTGTSEYGDMKNGQVFDINETETTETYFTTTEIYYGSMLYLNYSLSGYINDEDSLQNVVVDELFYNRTGYTRLSNGYWQSTGGELLNGSLLELSTIYFDNVDTFEEIHFYRLWQPNTYMITFEPNGGVFVGTDTIILSTTYDSNVLIYGSQELNSANLGSLTDITNITKLGYQDVGWSLDGDNNTEGRIVFDNSLGLIVGETYSLFDEEGNYIFAGNSVVYAVWVESPYTIKIMLNSANSYALQGQENDIPTESQKEFGLEFNIRYGATFENLFIGDNEAQKIKISELVPEREGYTFAGIFAVGQSRREAITDSSVFSTNVLSCSQTMSEDIVLTLYVSWIFDISYLSLELEDNTLPSLTYNGQQHTVYLAEYFKNGHSENGYVITLDENGQDMSIGLSQDMNSSISLTLTSNTANVDSLGGLSFGVRNVGNYVVNLNIIVSDDANYLNLGNVFETNYEFSISVQEANIRTEITNLVYLQNIKRIMAPFINDEFNLELASCVSLDSFTSLMKTKDATITGEVNDELNMQIYQYTMFKYFMLLDSNNGANHKLYKEWTFADYLEFMSDETNSENVANTVSNLNYFAFYDYANTENVVEIDGYDDLRLVSDHVQNVSLEIAIDRVVILSGTVSLVRPKNMYQMRVYLTDVVANTNNIENYDVQFDSDGDAYISTEVAYVLPQPLQIANLEETKSAYYQEGIENREVEWAGNRENIQYNGETLYLIENGIYVSADLFTSTGGDYYTDTVFSFTNDQNYLYFDNVSIVMETVDGATMSYTDISTYFKLILEENDIFTILNTDGIANVVVSAYYLTTENNMTSFELVDETLATEILRITRVYFNVDGTEESVYEAEGLEIGAYSSNGVMIYEIRENNANEVSIMLGPNVTKVVFAVESLDISEYISLYKWTDIEQYYVDGTMESSNSMTLDMSLVESTEDGLNELSYYAIFTDLVLVNYNLNFPSGYGEDVEDTSIMKLGEATANDLAIPHVNGLNASSLTVKSPTGEILDYTEIFLGEDLGNGRTYVGITEETKHAVVTIDVKWEVSQIEYAQILQEYKTAVNSFSSLAVTDIVLIYNENNGVYDYSYVWYFNDQQISTDQVMRLEGQGSYEESGNYKLVITATLNPEYYVSLEDASKTSTQIELTFSLQFVRHLLDSVTLPDAETTVKTYDGMEHLTDWSVEIDYFVFNRYSDDYEDEVTTEQLYYVTTGSVYFKIFFNGGEVSSMRNAGEYRIMVCFDEGIFDISGIDPSNLEFIYTINAASVDLSEFDFSESKQFNSIEPSLRREIHLSNENVTIQLRRDAGEDVGEYYLYFEDIIQTYKSNYTFTFGDTVIFENGTLTDDASTTSIGLFTITSSGTLRLSYQITEQNPATVSAEYSDEGYSLKLTEDFKLQIYCGTELFKEFALNLFDVSSGANISSSEVLNILKTKILDLQPRLFNSENYETAYDSMTYTYNFIMGEEISKYFTNVEFVSGYSFIINSIIIDVSQFVFEKTYDGETTVYVDTTGKEIDLDTYSGVYITAVYSTTHAGEDIRVDLSLQRKNSDVNLTNYSLSSNFVFGTINKLSATMTFVLNKDTYTYGEVSVNNVSNLIDSYTVTNSQNERITDLLVSGYFTISYSLPDDVKTNEKGFLYKGNYTINVNAEFQDFDMTINNPSFEIEALQYTRQISPNYIQITVLDRIQEYYEDVVTIQSTGDVITLKLYADNLVVGQTASMGNYDLLIVSGSETFLDGSIVVSVNEENNGLQVLNAETTVYVRIDDETILTNNTYNGQNYFVQGDVSKTISFSNATTSKSSTLSFFLKEANESGEIVEIPIASENVNFSELTIVFEEGNAQISDAGNYKLNIFATCAEYTNVVFAEDYYLSIDPVTVNISQFVFEKIYDGTTIYTISEFNEKISGDTVSILVQFDSAVADTGKTVALYLSGMDMNNYELSASTGVGTINKATAVVELASTEVEYGEVSLTQPLAYTVKADGANLLSSQYSLVLNIENAQYSSADYLNVGTYNVIMTSQSSTNYTLVFNPVELNVNKRDISIVLSVNGEFSAEFNSPEALSPKFTCNYMTELYETIQVEMTRTGGTSIGYYKVLSGESKDTNYNVVSVVDNSQLGAFRITPVRERLYLLLSEESSVSASSGGDIATITYDGNLYDTILIEERAENSGVYRLVFTNSENTSVRQQFDLNLYTYDSSTSTYNIADVTVEGLTSTIQFLYPTTVRNVGNYQIYSSGTTSESYEVKMGKEGEIYCFYLTIAKRELYFTNAHLSKIFDNKDAVFEYEDANEVLTGIVENEEMSLNIGFKQNGEIVKYVGTGYTVEAEIVGETISNYNLNMSSEDGTVVSASIERADMSFIINSQSYTYGDDFELKYKYQTEVDLTGYDVSRLGIQLVAPDISSYYSTSNALKVGEYDMILIFSAQDFKIGGYIIDNVEQDELTAKLIITPKELQLVEKDVSLQDIFTKTYDETNEVKITDEQGGLLFDVSGINQSEEGDVDSVQVLSARYVNEYVGQAIQINFELTGEDSDNYVISPWMYGVIKAIMVGIEFDYHADGEDVTSNVDDNQLPTLSQLAFPFMSTSYLTANSASSSTNSVKNFPTSLTGKTGFAFLNWTLKFENIVNGSDELVYLEDLVQTYALVKDYDGSTYSVVVGNDENTVRFLNALLTDENDLLGYYYKNHSDLNFVFNANWNTNQYRITIVLADENGNNASYGSVVIDDGDPSTENSVVTTNFLGDFDYDSTLTLRAIPNEHCYFAGFYDSEGRRYTGTEPFISIVSDGETEVFTITNVRQTYNLVVRFAIQKVNVILDLQEHADAIIESSDFEDIGNSQYQWETDYLTLQDMYLSDLPNILKTGFEIVSYSTSTETVEKSAFESTNITTLLPNSDDESMTLTLKPNLEEIGVVVTLDYGFDGITQQISVPFGQAYQTAVGWVENPMREGHIFDGWFDSSEQRVYGGDVLTSTEPHTLTAHWSIDNYVLELISPYATISEANITFVKSNSSYIANDVPYNIEITFKVTPINGYEISSAWSQGFDVVINADKTANVKFTMPAENVSYQLPVVAVRNTVTIQGEHLASVVAYDVTEEETEIDITNNQFRVETGRTFRLIISAETGYAVADITFEGDSVLRVDKNVENGILTATVEGISNDLTAYVSVTENENQIAISFEDPSVVESIEVAGRTYNTINELPMFTAKTGSTFSFYVKFDHGYAFGSYECDDFDVEYQLIETGAYIDNYLFELSAINSSGEIVISHTLARFTINMQVVSFNENQEMVDIPGNVAFVEGETQAEVEYNSVVTLTYQAEELYNFAGWSKDGTNLFSTEATLEYTVTQDETIYAIFSTLKFDIQFATYNYYTIYDEYNDPNRTEIVYTEISGGRYFDSDTGREIAGIELYYGSNKTITFRVPTGYMYYGYGFRNGERFEYIEIQESNEEEVEVEISSLLLDENIVDLKLYIVVKAYSLSMEFETKIDIDGAREEDVDVGYIALQDPNGNDVNRYGYVDGTRIHYMENSFVDGQVVSNKNFEVMAYTGDIIYLKVMTLKEGYRFSNIVANRQDVLISKLQETEDYLFFEISGLVGGTEELYFEVLFKPTVNVINLLFTDDDIQVEGGAFTFNITAENRNKVWTSGREYSAVVVSAYTDSYFEVNALIRAGYIVDGDNLQIVDSGNIIVPNSVTYQSLDVIESGYTGKITFRVANYLGVSSIVIEVNPLSYSVALMEDTNLLATIDNVNFNSVLNLTQYNAENITIFDERIYFLNGKLKVDLQKDQHNFEGYFTYQNGAGVQYIDSQGNAINAWQESGYVLNLLTSKYELSENASIDPETGVITIKLYLYWSYLKTRISFEFVPDVRTGYTAQDMISGVDFSNSWFYETAPLYIEISFNTDIHITAPEIEGYKFYKFVISQKNANGIWLTDVTSFSNDIPWSTNEYDRIVECRIQVIYFAKVEVTIFGGKGSFNLYQESSDNQAILLLNEGYVDTTKEFNIEAVAGEGYEFLRWENSDDGSFSFDKTLKMTITQKTNLVMSLQGVTVTLSFEDYDTTFGQITNLRVQSLDNSYNTYRLGGYSGDEFLKTLTQVDVRVGDKLTFVLSVDFGFAVVWNRAEISFVEYTGNMYYFAMSVPSDCAGQTLEIIPTFQDEILAVYISRDFIETDISDIAIDYNNINLAGYTTFNGQRVDFVSCDEGQEIRIVTVTNARYEIDNIIIRNYDRTYENMNEFYSEDGIIILTTDFMEQNNIVGNVQIQIEYRRELWEEELLAVNSFEGRGTSGNPYQIWSVEDLILMMTYVNGGTLNSEGIRYKDCYFILMEDLQLTSKFWTPIGTEENSFNGHFDFNNHKINGIYTAYFYDPVHYNGLFGVLGFNAQIVEKTESIWYIYLIIGLLLLLIIILIILILLSRKRKRQREELSKR